MINISNSIKIAFITIAIILSTLIIQSDTIFAKDLETKNIKTAQEAIDEMKVGWNLGNTLDSCDYQKKDLGKDIAISYYETHWGNPQTTEELIQEIKKAGFNSIRVPVTYYDHIDENGKIDELWFQRVETIVNYVLDNNMYCILDVHHDTGLCEIGSWIRTDADKYEENAENLRKLWFQIANRFKDYDYKLVFEGFNEIVDTNKNYSWESGYNNTINVNKLNQVFIDTVRSTGGKNADRFLAVSTFGAITDEQKLETFVMPKDTAKNKIMLALHDYSSSPDAITSMFNRIKKYCIDKNIPVILDEFGTQSSFGTEEQRAEIANKYVSEAKKLGITCFWWDDGGNYILFNRRNMDWEYEKIKDAIILPYKNEQDNNNDNSTEVVIKEYKVDEKNKYIYRIPLNATAYEVLSNVIGADTCKIYNSSNEEITGNEIISTNMKISINNKIYTLITIGDINGDGKISITDLVKLKLFSINILTPNKIEKIASDINNDEKITITDIVKLNLMLLGLI